MGNFSDLIDRDKVQQCPRHYVLALTDTMNVMNGKWKLPIIASLLHGKSRFKDLQDNIEKITPRMLSKELKELEINGIVERKVYPQSPVLIEYVLTVSGHNITRVIDTMIDWGMVHRREIIKSRWL
ncbi:transcriptional regulator [Pedobacter petrophilus]|uniref:Transcriptional regulator n=2 Tax=Pedobacter TaxID=84567 RepID=A0A7K0G434_9SPHI|nr:helix-turn-helix domain-containing protein [Pedobacter petrophilus]MRX78567.1 transcriptional regulator [Pedobacter petrophilus]